MGKEPFSIPIKKHLHLTYVNATGCGRPYIEKC